ncbi:5-formyltetrahydrofolate cyclo-ligase [Thermodesulfatator indicus DSM 15286]|uniref:5-formyltetrahydrofolate cyclo-ligase n=1 Tax=Thermodesulfatator indicus (strain DSM 15286 / JCM 11887 / CIR29812) TaxID=667014 RepID=F8ADH7_THEID|nr:5-formyltetrahydrofolate cyclo-ligase [Thermodesulfatator indicus]AEH44851.1 5-formyltetrahydrofolate cyclo-ligase [Thermodesulfatator indicus DSM 15286]
MTPEILAKIKHEKKILREKIWELLSERGVARFPGAFGRIPNFVGAEAAAEKAAETEAFKRARFVKANPDSPQFPLRVKALLEGKTVFMAVPKLKAPKPFLRLDPQKLKVHPLKGATIKGAFKYGEPVSPEEMPKIDLVITGCVAVTRRGERLGKGGGFADLELAILAHFGKINPETPILTTVHPLQIVDEVPLEEHDFSVDIIVTPEEVIWAEGPKRFTQSIIWEALPEDKLKAIPVLKCFWEKENVSRETM